MSGRARYGLFKVLGSPALDAYSLTVYNRWGERVFSTTEQGKGWNGTYNGSQQATGNYVWICAYQKTGSKEKKT